MRALMVLLLIGLSIASGQTTPEELSAETPSTNVDMV